MKKKNENLKSRPHSTRYILITLAVIIVAVIGSLFYVKAHYNVQHLTYNGKSEYIVTHKIKTQEKTKRVDSKIQNYTNQDPIYYTIQQASTSAYNTNATSMQGPIIIQIYHNGCANCNLVRNELYQSLQLYQSQPKDRYIQYIQISYDSDLGKTFLQQTGYRDTPVVISYNPSRKNKNIAAVQSNDASKIDQMVKFAASEK